MNSVVPKDEQKDERNVKKVTMQVLQDERKCSLAAILMSARFTNGARRRIEKEGAIVSLTVIVTGGAKTKRRRKDRDGGRERPPGWFDKWRIEWGEVWSPFVVLAFEGSPGGIDTERAKHQ